MGELLRITRSAVVFLMERHTRRDTILETDEIWSWGGKWGQFGNDV